MLRQTGATVMLPHSEWMAKREAEAAKWTEEDTKRERSDRRWTMALVIACTLLGAVGGTFIGGILVPNPTAAVRALCDDVMARLMQAETMVELEREKFLIGSMRCGVERRLETLRPAPSVP